MIKIYFVLILIVCLACNKYKKNTHTDPEFIEYLQDFENSYQINLKNYPINFKNLEYPTIGQCEYPEITIDPDKWSVMSGDERRIVIFHELGHCVLGLGHDEEWIVDELNQTIPRSIMYPYLVEELAYERNWVYYKNQLVGR